MFWTETIEKHLVGIRLHLTGFFSISRCVWCALKTYTLYVINIEVRTYLCWYCEVNISFKNKDLTKAASSFSKFDRMNKINLSCKHSSTEVYLFTQFSVQTNAHDKANIDSYCTNQTKSPWKFSQFHTGRGGFTWSWERNPSAFASMKHLFYT